MKDDIFDGFDEGVGLEKPYVQKRGQTWADWRRGRPMLRIGRTGEDGTVSDWAALFEATPLPLMDSGYAALRGGPIYYNMFLQWLEDQRSKETRVPAPVPPKDWKYDLYTLLTKPRPTPKEKAAIDYLFKMAEAEGLRSLNINETLRTGAKVYHDKVQSGTVAASMATRPDIITRLQKAKLL